MSSAERVKKHRERRRADGRRRIELRANDDAAAEALRAVAADMADGRLRPAELLELSARARAPDDLSRINTVAEFRQWLEQENLLVEHDEDWPPPRDRSIYPPHSVFE